MAAADGALPDSSPEDRAEVWAEALATLEQASQWELPEARWQAIDLVLIEMETARAADDLAGLNEATIDLELFSPLRLIKIGSSQGQPSPQIRDRLNRLVQSLGGTALAPRRAYDDDELDHDDDQR